MKIVVVLLMLLGFCCVSNITVAEEQIASKQETTTQSSGAMRAQAIADLMGKNRLEKNQGTEVKAPETDTGSMALKMIQGLGIVAGMFLIGAHFYKKYVIKNVSKPARSIKILERASLGGKSALILAEIEGQRVLVGMGADTVSLMKVESQVVKLEETIVEGSEELWFELQKASASS